MIIGENVSRTDIMASFRLANEDVLDKLSPPLRLAINQTDIYKENDSYDNTSESKIYIRATSSELFVLLQVHLSFILFWEKIIFWNKNLL